MTSARSSAWFRIAAVSTISTMKVDRPHAGKDLAHQPDLGAFGGNVASHLGQDRDQRVLPEPCGFTSHVRPGQQRDGGAVALGIEDAVICDEGRAGSR